MSAVGPALNLQPPTVFSIPVKIFIPCLAFTDVSGLSLYWYDGTDWFLVCGPDGVVASTAEGYMVPGSRMNHDSSIEIKVYHFTGLLAAEPFELAGDLDHDGDADGADLKILITDLNQMSLSDFASDFNKMAGL